MENLFLIRLRNITDNTIKTERSAAIKELNAFKNTTIEKQLTLEIAFFLCFVLFCYYHVLLLLLFLLLSYYIYIYIYLRLN